MVGIYVVLYYTLYYASSFVNHERERKWGVYQKPQCLTVSLILMHTREEKKKRKYFLTNNKKQKFI